MSSAAHVEKILIFLEKLSSVLKIGKFLYFSMIYQIRDVMMSISARDRMHFWIYLLKHNSLSNQTWPIDIYKQGKYFSRILWTIWRTGAKFQVLFSLITCYNYSITSYDKIPVFHFFEKVNKETIKNGKCELLKMVISRYIVILIKSWKGLELVSSLQHWA